MPEPREDVMAVRVSILEPKPKRRRLKKMSLKKPIEKKKEKIKKAVEPEKVKSAIIKGEL